MPLIEAFTCDRCDFHMPTGWGGYVYATAADGQRIVCPHPAEFTTIRTVTGLSYGDARAAGRTGFNSDCVCLGCHKQFSLDLERDARRCPACASQEVKSTRELVEPCPLCKQGTIRRGSPIRWPLDPDRASLPVPQIVKDICEYVETRQVPVSLRAAAEVIRRTPDMTGRELFVTCSRLLGWWQGRYTAKDKPPATSFGPHNPTWLWVKALPAIIEATPGLARLLRLDEGGGWRFDDQIGTDERRGIKNYAREHYKPPVMS